MTWDETPTMASLNLGKLGVLLVSKVQTTDQRRALALDGNAFLDWRVTVLGLPLYRHVGTMEEGKAVALKLARQWVREASETLGD